MVTCLYDSCHEFEAGSYNARYCPDCKCKRKREASVKRLSQPLQYDEQLWTLQENRKIHRVSENVAKNQWILKNKTFAIFDIEASNLDADFGEVLCACIKPLGGKIRTFSLPTFRKGDKWRLISDAEIVSEIRDELRKYDYIVTWYGTKFDMPYMTTRLMAADEETLGIMRHVDLYYTARWKLKLHSNRLASVGDFMFGKTKKDAIVGPIWLAAIRGDADALQYLIKHCQKDVVELERVFQGLVPHRNLAATPLRSY